MSNLTPRIDALDTVAVKLDLINVPNTQITQLDGTPRQIQDLADDLSAHAGINRIQTQEIFEIQSEQGPNGEEVFGAVNDKFNQVRFAGPWFQEGFSHGSYIRVPNSSTNGFVEISFYGTGLNLLWLVGTNRDIRVTIDGGSESASIVPISMSSVLHGRSYATNQPLSIASGLALGKHTVKIRSLGSGALFVYGFEILNESNTLKINPGSFSNGKSISQHASLFDASFDVETGSDAGVGGAVLLYEEDVTIKKAVNWAEDNQLNLGAATHVNEEEIGRHHYRKFGAGRSDDFSTLGSVASDRFFILDDGTTTLIGDGAQVRTATQALSLSNIGTPTSIILTFIGTGLDWIRKDDGVNSNTLTVSVDGNSIGTPANTPDNTPTLERVVSGLPYGTHTVRFQRADNIGGAPGIMEFIVYGPKAPTLPAGAVPLDAYNLMADFDGTAAIGTTAADQFQQPTGVLSKSAYREFTYIGANWTVSGVNTSLWGGGSTTCSLNDNQPWEYTFWGTGFTMQTNTAGGGSAGLDVRIDGVLNASGVNRGNLTNNGGGNYTIAVGSGLPARLEFTGLSLGLHTISLDRAGGAGAINVTGFHIHTPIHAPKENGSVIIQDTLQIGSQGLEDFRRFPDDVDFGYNEVTQVAGFTTTSNLFQPTAIGTTVKVTKKGRYHIHFSGQNGGSNGATQHFIFYKNGKEFGTLVRTDTASAGGQERAFSMHEDITLAPGEYSISLYGKAVNSVTTTMSLGRLTVNRIGD